MMHPGEYLKERFLDPLGITPYRLAKGIRVQQTRISQILRGMRAISPDTAVRLGAFFGVPPEWFMELQTRYDLARAASAAKGIERFPGRYWVRPSGAQRLDSAPPIQPTTHRIDPEFRERVRARAAMSPRLHRKMVAVEYGDGMKALVGEEVDESSS
jgi:addiction module HigA family antidote